MRASDVKPYRAYVVETGLADYKASPGNRGAYMLTRVDGDEGHVLTISFWDSYGSISHFAGADITKARYYPEDRRYLLDFPEFVEHYEVD